MYRLLYGIDPLYYISKSNYLQTASREGRVDDLSHEINFTKFSCYFKLLLLLQQQLAVLQSTWYCQLAISKNGDKKVCYTACYTKYMQLEYVQRSEGPIPRKQYSVYLDKQYFVCIRPYILRLKIFPGAIQVGAWICAKAAACRGSKPACIQQLRWIARANITMAVIS